MRVHGLCDPLGLVLGAVILLLVPGCGGDGSSEATSSAAASGASSAAGGGTDAAALCVDAINQHRASIKLAPYARWSDEEACTSAEAQKDSMSGTAHGAFGSCKESAQDECPGWPGPPEKMIASCMQMMWDEGPGDFAQHGHYLNMSSTAYTKVSCGFFALPDGSVWATQNFN
jgi:hypothetical protein